MFNRRTFLSLAAGGITAPRSSCRRGQSSGGRLGSASNEGAVTSSIELDSEGEDHFEGGSSVSSRPICNLNPQIGVPGGQQYGIGCPSSRSAASPTTDACCLSDFLQRNMSSRPR